MGALKKKVSTPLKKKPLEYPQYHFLKNGDTSQQLLWKKKSNQFFDLLGGIPSIHSFNPLALRSSRQVFVDSEVVFVFFCKRFSWRKGCFLKCFLCFLISSVFSRKKGFLYLLYITFVIKGWKEGGFIKFCWCLRSTSSARWWGRILDGDLDLNV